jgi:hypothetical protein
MSITIARVIDYLRYVAPLLIFWFAWPSTIIFTWRLTLWISERSLKQNMLKYSDKILGERIRKLEEQAYNQRAYIDRLEAQNLDLIAQMKAALQHTSKVQTMLMLGLPSRNKNREGGEHGA